MLYIFQVDLGCMYIFELDLTLESVSNLKNAIAAKCNISVDNQVLLISGGDYLEDNCPVHQYDGAGTLSNPIFLFDKSAIMSLEQYSYNSLTNQNDQLVDACFKRLQIEFEDTSQMNPTLKTIIKRTEIAKKLNQLTTELMTSCEQLIKDQHLMYQGWQAVIANLDDAAGSFVDHVSCFEDQLKLFFTKRDYYSLKLKSFRRDLEILDQIKTLSCLHQRDDEIKSNNEHLSTKKQSQDFDRKSQNNVNKLKDQKTICSDNKENVVVDENVSPNRIEQVIDVSVDSTTRSSDEQTINDEHSTLMRLISQKDKMHCLDKVAVYCNTMLEQFTEQLLDRIKEEMNLIAKTINENRKIKKIESRLYNLEMLLLDVRQHVQDQNLLTFSFVQNQNSANVYNDSTIIADLCCSHKSQLDLMFEYMRKVMTIKKKFQNSKRELQISLLARLKTIMICETDLNSLNWRVLLYGESLKKLKRSLEVVDQLNQAPKVYFSVFQEVNRRNKFNCFFKFWSNFIVQMNSKLIPNENAKRDQFRNQISSHFLKSFFPKFDDNVPEFACQLPEKYDHHIPTINEQDFFDFIESNKQFDSELETEDNVLNAFVCKMQTNEINNGQGSIDEIEKMNLTNFVESLFNENEEQQVESEIDQIKNRLNNEYRTRLKALKCEFKTKFDQEISQINRPTNDDLESSSISNNISDRTSTGDLSATDICLTNTSSTLTYVDQNGDELVARTNKCSKVEDKQLSLFFNLTNCDQPVFKNLINELLSVKYTDYLRDQSDRPIQNGPSFISFVSTVFAITWPNYFR